MTFSKNKRFLDFCPLAQ